MSTSKDPNEVSVQPESGAHQANPDTRAGAALEQRRAFLRKLSGLGLAHFAVAYVGRGAHALPRQGEPPEGTVCGQVVNNDVITDADCAVFVSGQGYKTDRDCGVMTELGGISSDNRCALPNGDPLPLHSDADCDKVHPLYGSPSQDADCGLVTLGGHTVDNACGKLEHAYSSEYTVDIDCGASSGNGVLKDNSCALATEGSTTTVDLDCGMAMPTSGTHSDSRCGLPTPIPDVYYADG